MEKKQETSKKMSRGLQIILTIILSTLFFGLSIFNPMNRQYYLSNGSLSEVYYRGAKALEERGDFEGAKKDYKFALWLNPYHKEAEEALNKTK